MDQPFYRQAGVDYSLLDPVKAMAMKIAAHANTNIPSHLHPGVQYLRESVGESVALFHVPRANMILAHQQETLGTKNHAADLMYEITGEAKWYYNVGYCAVAMILNDISTHGAQPFSTQMHLAAGDSKWFADEARARALIQGWADACFTAGSYYTGGETPTLKRLITPGKFVIDGSAVGVIAPANRYINGPIEHGDVILLFDSSGLHANGLSACHQIAETLPEGYATRMPNDQMFGEAVLKRTVLYGPLVRMLLDDGIAIKYLANITGHAFEKVMRAKTAATYIIERLPTPQLVFEFIQQQASLSAEEMYHTFNMGAGYCAIVAPEHAEKATITARINGYGVTVAGHVEIIQPTPPVKKVVVVPLGLEYTAEV